MFGCEERWAEDVADKLFFRMAKLRLAALPLTGTTTLLSVLANHLEKLGYTSVRRADGRQITESNQDGYIEELVEQIEGAVDQDGDCILLFDHYSHAMRRSRAARMQAKLFGLLINSTRSDRIGCLVVHRCTELSSANIQASSFLSRLELIGLPVLTTEEIDGHESRKGLRTAVSQAGRLPAIVAQAMSHGAFSARSWEFFLQNSLPEIARDVPRGSFDAMASAIERDDVLLGFCPPGADALPQVIRDRFAEQVSAFQGAWPVDTSAAAKRFARLLGRQGASYWYDPYIFDPAIRDKVCRFVENIRGLTDVELNIMGMKRTEWSDALVQETLSTLNAIPNVHARVVPFRHSKTLHDRHLVARSNAEGYAMPEIRDVAAIKRRGTAIEAKFLKSPADYAMYWRDSAT